MSDAQGITQELSLGDVVSRTFDLYRKDFTKYIIPFLIAETIIGVVTALARNSFSVSAIPPTGSTSQVYATYLSGVVGPLVALVAVIFIISLVFYPICVGAAIKMASDEISTGTADLERSLRFTVSRIVWFWIVGIVVGIIVVVGFVLLIIPGIILAIMFSLVLPVIVIEKADFASMGRSRKLVGGRWLKTFALGIVFFIIIGIAAVVVTLISSPFGAAGGVVSSILSAFYVPLLPIGLTVYYYSNSARIAPPQAAQATTVPWSTAQGSMKFCPNCGTQMPSASAFCPSCGARQTV